MINEITFKYFKALRETALPLGRFTLMVGPNGSGKSTALQAFEILRSPQSHVHADLVTRGCDEDVTVRILWSQNHPVDCSEVVWKRHATPESRDFCQNQELSRSSNHATATLSDRLGRVRVYALEPQSIASPVSLSPDMQLNRAGGGLAGVLDRLRDKSPERFEALNSQLHQWLPEYDRVLFDVPHQGHRSFSLRTTRGYAISASDLSHGTMMALAILTVAYLPDPPPLVAVEDPDRGLHPRLLREIRDALYRLAYPQDFDEEREPVQVIATTHSPYLLDLFRDHPEEVVIAEKQGGEARFHRLIDRPDIDDILHEASLGEVWYSGILGGVPAGT